MTNAIKSTVSVAALALISGRCGIGRGRSCLTNIMLPSQSISDNYELYVIELNNRVLQEGVIGSQTPVSVTLLREDGAETVIARENIRRMVSSAVSGMPEGLEEEISVQEMAHLLSFSDQFVRSTHSIVPNCRHSAGSCFRAAMGIGRWKAFPNSGRMQEDRSMPSAKPSRHIRRPSVDENTLAGRQGIHQPVPTRGCRRRVPS